MTTGEAAYTRSNIGLSDAMPSFWKNLSTEIRERLMQRIEKLRGESREEDFWATKKNILSLTEIIPLGLIPSLRICYQVAKNNPDVIIGPFKGSDETGIVTKQKKAATCSFESFLLLPPNLLKETKHASTAAGKLSASMKLFQHVVQFRNRTNFEAEKLEVSAYLDIDVTKDQQRLLNPTVLDTVTGFIIKDSQGEGAKKRLPQRRLNMVDGSVSSHCCILNSTERLELVRRSNEVAAIMGEIEVDRLRAKEATKKKKDAEKAAKEARKKVQAEKNVERDNEARITCEKMMHLLNEKGEEHITRLTVPVLRALIRFVFQSDQYKRTDIRKPEWVLMAREMYQNYLNDNAPTSYSATAADETQTTADEQVVMSSEENESEDEEIFSLAV